MRPLPSSQHCMSPQVSAAASERRNPASDRTATRARSKRARSGGLLGRFDTAPAKAGLDGGEADHGQHIGGEGADWRWGFERRLPHPFREARTPRSRQGDSSFAHWWALAMAEVARRRVECWRRHPRGRPGSRPRCGARPAGTRGPPPRRHQPPPAGSRPGFA